MAKLQVKEQVYSKAKKWLQMGHMDIGPSFDFGEGGDIGKQSRQNKGKNGGKKMEFSAFRAGIGGLFEALDEEFEGMGCGHIDLHVIKGKTEKELALP